MSLSSVLLVSLGFCSTVCAQGQRFSFNIPAQPLAVALESYGSITGRDVLYSSMLAVGRRSTAVQGLLPADAALMIMLEGTGLAARYETSGSFVLLAAPPTENLIPSPAIGQFYGRLQEALRTALCADRKARPGTYRIAAQFWIGSAGEASRYERLSSAGAQSLDDSLDRDLRNLRVGAPPPAGLPQPVTIVIAPEAPGATTACGVRQGGGAQ